MSERARTARRKEAPADGGAIVDIAGDITGIIGALSGAIEQFASAMHRDAEETTQDGDTRGGGNGARVVFGYTLKMGRDGVSAERFGHVPEPGKPAAPADMQPITEVYQDGGTVVVIAELPGADPGLVACRVDGGRLRIEAGGARRYRKDVALPTQVRPESMTQSVCNGILEVRLARADAP